MQDFELNGHLVNSSSAPYIIAEMSGNHNQSLERALNIVEAAHRSGAHAIKIQTYLPETMTLNLQKNEFQITDKDSLWTGKNLYQLYQEAHTPWEWHRPIMERSRELGITCFSTPFDETAVDFLEDLNVPFYKIASFENIDLPLIKKVAATQKPIIMSTGMASLSEIEEAVQTIRSQGNEKIILLKCTSSYPCSPENSNIKTIPYLRDVFNVQVGLSDHTLGLGVAVAAVAMGATVIEKHFTLSRSEGGVDSAFSLEPEEFAQLVIECRNAHMALGKVRFGTTESEKKSLVYRRSLYFAQDLKVGDVLDEKNLRTIRPGFGLAPKHLQLILGKKVKKDVSQGTPVSWEHLL